MFQRDEQAKQGRVRIFSSSWIDPDRVDSAFLSSSRSRRDYTLRPLRDDELIVICVPFPLRRGVTFDRNDTIYNSLAARTRKEFTRGVRSRLNDANAFGIVASLPPLERKCFPSSCANGLRSFYDLLLATLYPSTASNGPHVYFRIYRRAYGEPRHFTK